MAERPRTAVVHYNGLPYTRDLSMCRRALTHRQVEGKFLGGMADLATESGCHRSVVSRFFAGLNVSTEMTMRILGSLELDFDQVHKPVPPSDASDGDG